MRVPVQPRMIREAMNLTADKRARLEGALLGASATQLVSVRAGDIRDVLGVAGAVSEAQELIGELVIIRRQMAVLAEIAGKVPLLQEQLDAMRAERDLLATRIEAAKRFLKAGI